MDIFGGYSNTPWTRSEGYRYRAANKAFLFVLSGGDISSPCKMKLKNANSKHTVYLYSGCGPTFGGGHDIKVSGSNVYLNLGHTYASSVVGKLVRKNDGADGGYARFAIKEIEVFALDNTLCRAPVTQPREYQGQSTVPQVSPVTRFAQDINEAINARQDSLLQAELEVLHLEGGFEDEQQFIGAFASGDTKDVITLNVSGEMMASKRSTLQIADESVLAQQFDDSRWTEQGHSNNARAKEWASEEVGDWAQNVSGLPENIGTILEENEITGRELLAMSMEGLKMVGIERAGTLCLLLKEIKSLEKASQDVMTLIEHSPYCFGKILDYLRFKNLHSLGLAEEPALPTVSDSHQSRFEKVVKYYFPGDSANFILGDSN